MSLTDPSPKEDNEPKTPVTDPDEQDSDSDHHLRVLGKMVGTAFIFLGFLQIFLSIALAACGGSSGGPAATLVGVRPRLTGSAHGFGSAASPVISGIGFGVSSA